MAERQARAPIKEAEVPWVVAYLREDIQDLRNEVREVRRSVQRVDEKLDVGLTRLDAKIDARTDELRQEMSVQFRWMVGSSWPLQSFCHELFVG